MSEETQQLENTPPHVGSAESKASGHAESSGSTCGDTGYDELKSSTDKMSKRDILSNDDPAEISNESSSGELDKKVREMSSETNPITGEDSSGHAQGTGLSQSGEEFGTGVKGSKQSLVRDSEGPSTSGNELNLDKNQASADIKTEGQISTSDSIHSIVVNATNSKTDKAIDSSKSDSFKQDENTEMEGGNQGQSSDIPRSRSREADDESSKIIPGNSIDAGKTNLEESARSETCQTIQNESDSIQTAVETKPVATDGGPVEAVNTEDIQQGDQESVTTPQSKPLDQNKRRGTKQGYRGRRNDRPRSRSQRQQLADADGVSIKEASAKSTDKDVTEATSEVESGQKRDTPPESSQAAAEGAIHSPDDKNGQKVVEADTKAPREVARNETESSKQNTRLDAKSSARGRKSYPRHSRSRDGQPPRVNDQLSEETSVKSSTDATENVQVEAPAEKAPETTGEVSDSAASVETRTRAPSERRKWGRSRRGRRRLVRMYGHFWCHQCRTSWGSSYVFCAERHRPSMDEQLPDVMRNFVPVYKQKCKMCQRKKGPSEWDFIRCSRCGKKGRQCRCLRGVCRRCRHTPRACACRTRRLMCADCKEWIADCQCEPSDLPTVVVCFDCRSTEIACSCPAERPHKRDLCEKCLRGNPCVKEQSEIEVVEEQLPPVSEE